MSAPDLTAGAPPPPLSAEPAPAPLALTSEIELVLAGACAALGARSRLVVALPPLTGPGTGFDPSEWTGRLPFADGAFDAVVLVAPSQTFPPTEALAVARDAARVARLGVLQLEANDEPRVKTALATWASITPVPVASDTITSADVALLIVRKVGSDDAPVVALEAELQQERTAANRLRSEVHALHAKLDRARDEIEDVLHSPAARVTHALIENRVARVTAASALRAVDRVRGGLRRRGLVWPRSFASETDPLPELDDLGFEGIATRARPADPQEFLRQQPRVVALCHPSWRGIRAATYGQCEHVIEVAGFASTSHARRLAGFLRDCGAERVVMNGFPPGTALFARELREISPRTRFFIIYHGSPALSYGEDVVLQEMIELFEEGSLHKLGFVKYGLAEYFRSRGCRAEYVMNICRLPNSAPARATSGTVRVGVFAPTVSHKNVEAQLLAALMVPGVEVHTIEPVAARYLQAEHKRTVSHHLMPRPEFLELLRSMHATSYVSLVECYPMTVLESIFSGAVCVTSNTSVIFQDDPTLQDALVVEHHDSPAAIARKLSRAIERREELVPRAQQHLELLNQRAELRWAGFIED